jgi:hypothetical protein
MANAGAVMLIKAILVRSKVSRFLVFIIIFLMLLSFLLLWEFEDYIKELCTDNMNLRSEEFRIILRLVSAYPSPLLTCHEY